MRFRHKMDAIIAAPAPPVVVDVDDLIRFIWCDLKKVIIKRNADGIFFVSHVDENPDFDDDGDTPKIYIDGKMSSSEEIFMIFVMIKSPNLLDDITTIYYQIDDYVRDIEDGISKADPQEELRDGGISRLILEKLNDGSYNGIFQKHYPD